MANADGKGCQINLDNGEGKILEGFVTDDIRAPSSFLEIVFECPDKLIFGADPDYYFTYLSIDWVPVTLDEGTGANNTWHYDLGCYPRCIFTKITKPAKNTQELARALGLKLSELSDSLEVPCPIINQYAGNVIQMNRLYSLEKAYNERDFGKAVYTYVNSKEMYSATWKSMTSQVAVSLTLPKNTDGQTNIQYQDYQFYSLFNSAYGAIPWKQNDYLARMMGTQFKMDTTVPAVFLNVYTIKSEKIPDFDTGLPFLCVYSRRNLLDVNAFTHYFSNIKYIG